LAIAHHSQVIIITEAKKNASTFFKNIKKIKYLTNL